MRRLLHFAFLFLLASPCVHAATNYWQRQGTVISHVSTTFYPGQPNVLFEGGSQLGLGAGNVFKMWYENATSPYGIYYAESLDGTTWTQDPSNPIIAAVGGGVKIFKHAGTYYLYGGPNWSGSVIYAYTSTNGVTWTLQNAIALVPSQTWENGGIYQLAVVDVVGGTWYGYYCGFSSNTSGFLEGLATSTDGIHWTKDAGNPVASMSSGTFTSGGTWSGSGNFTFQKVNGKYYG